MLAAAVGALSSQISTAATGTLVSCDLGGHTKVHVRVVDSTCFVAPGQTVPCLSLTNIQVAPEERRRGHARRALRALHGISRGLGRVLLVENVVSDHMHTLIGELKGRALPGSTCGRKGCNYYITPTPQAQFQDMAVG